MNQPTVFTDEVDSIPTLSPPTPQPPFDTQQRQQHLHPASPSPATVKVAPLSASTKLSEPNPEMTRRRSQPPTSVERSGKGGMYSWSGSDSILLTGEQHLSIQDPTIDPAVTQTQEETDRQVALDTMYDMLLVVEDRQRKHLRDIKRRNREQDAATAGLKLKDFEDNLETPDRYAGSENLVLDSGQDMLDLVLADPHKIKVRLVLCVGVAHVHKTILAQVSTYPALSLRSKNQPSLNPRASTRTLKILTTLPRSV